MERRGPSGYNEYKSCQNSKLTSSWGLAVAAGDKTGAPPGSMSWLRIIVLNGRRPPEESVTRVNRLNLLEELGRGHSRKLDFEEIREKGKNPVAKP